jgi:hypothetical protein
MERENQQTPDGLELADSLHNGPLVLATQSHAKRKEGPSLFICAHNRISLARPAVLRLIIALIRSMTGGMVEASIAVAGYAEPGSWPVARTVEMKRNRMRIEVSI